ncbi:MAG: hypothetical protein RL380_1043 [Verrucomicrobiota bacterium]
MNVQSLQRADRWLGVPLCFLLTLWRRIFDWRREPLTPPRRLLVVKFAEQGSTVLAHTALRRAGEIVGRENVFFVCLADNRFILDALALVPTANVITVPQDGPLAFGRGMWTALRTVRRLKIDTVVDMEFFSRGTAAFAFLTGARRRVGFHAFFAAGPYRGNLLTHRLLYNPHQHTTEAFYCLVEATLKKADVLPTFDLRPAAVCDVEPPRFAPGAEEVAAVQAMLPDAAGKCPPLILLNPNASDLLPLRRWPVERYVTLARRLLENFPAAHVVFTGGLNEATATAELARQVGHARCCSLAGRTTLRQLLVLYTLAEVLVTNDSGPAHFAVLTPVRTVTLFGPETPTLFAARTPRNTPLWVGLACSPCVNAFNNRQSSCRDNICMQAISVEQVFAAVVQAYGQRI